MPLSGPPLDRPIALTEVLAIGLKTKPDELALVSNESRWTWRELDAAADRVAAHYLALGLKPGDRVASLLPNRGVLIVHYLVCLRAGLAATPLNYRYQAPEIDHALEVSGASILVAHAERDDDLAKSQLAGKLPLGRVSFGAKDGRGRSLEEYLQTPPPPVTLPAPPPSAASIIFFTSGSTGKPKGVTHTHETFGWLVCARRRASSLPATSNTADASSATASAASQFWLSCCER